MRIWIPKFLTCQHGKPRNTRLDPLKQLASFWVQPLKPSQGELPGTSQYMQPVRSQQIGSIWLTSRSTPVMPNRGVQIRCNVGMWAHASLRAVNQNRLCMHIPCLFGRQWACSATCFLWLCSTHRVFVVALTKTKLKRTTIWGCPSLKHAHVATGFRD